MEYPARPSLFPAAPRSPPSSPTRPTESRVPHEAQRWEVGPGAGSAPQCVCECQCGGDAQAAVERGGRGRERKRERGKEAADRPGCWASARSRTSPPAEAGAGRAQAAGGRHGEPAGEPGARRALPQGAHGHRAEPAKSHPHPAPAHR